MRRNIGAALAAVAICISMMGVTDANPRAVDDDAQEALSQAQKAANVFTEVMGISDEEKTVPKALVADAEVIAVFPDVVKAAFIFGGTGGKGVASARDPRTGRWGPPLFLKVGGASWGAQIGAQSADFVLVGANRAAQDVFTKGEWTLGADAAVVAGPVGRKASAGTDWKLNAQLLSYSRSKGLFAGVSLGGAKVQLDDDLNEAVYGNATPKDILAGRATATTAASGVSVFPTTLAKYSKPRPD